MRLQTILAMGALLLASCTSQTQPVSQTEEALAAAKIKICPDGSTAKGNKPCPPAPAPAPTTGTTDAPAPDGLSGEVAIADNFTTNWIEPGVPESTSPDEVGAFRFTCLGGHLAKNDPLVYPGQKGASHLHQFFGNTSTDENSNYTSLRTTGGSTCTRSTTESPQRSAYWMPAMLDGAGNAVKADWMNTYYKQIPNGSAACSAAPDASHLGRCVPMPNGLRFILGYNMKDGTGGPTDLNSPDQWAMGFDCVKTDGTGISYTGNKPTIAGIVATGQCPTGAWLRVFLVFPDCWDGKNLDSADHRTHMTYATGAVVLGQRACPADHPYKIPEIAIQAFFTTDANFDAGKWHLSSDEMMPGTTPGKTLHMDYWEAWSPTVKNMWQTFCINGHLSCSAGELGNGQQIKGMQQSTVTGIPRHVLVPLSSF